MRKELRDKCGYVEGYIEEDGTITDRHGYFVGRVDSSGRITDNHGYYKGTVDSQGRVSDQHGYPIGTMGEDGGFYSTDYSRRDFFPSDDAPKGSTGGGSSIISIASKILSTLMK